MSALPRQDIINSRMPIVIFFLATISGLLLFAVSRYQWLPPEVQREFLLRGQANVSSVRRLPAERGLIFDRQGQPLAFNTIEYEIGVSPNLVTRDRRLDVARQLGVILQRDEFELLQLLNTNTSWQLIARPVNAQIGQQIADLNIFGLIINPLSKRFYPQGELMSAILGFVIESNDNTRGAMGVEGSYNQTLAGRTLQEEVSAIPFGLPTDTKPTGQRGMSLVLTIDRDIQFWVEEELRIAIAQTGATRGTIIVMNPRNGDILAMASLPTFDPNNFIRVSDPNLLRNPAVSEAYEPGSVSKVLTVAAALEQGVITREWTYNDQGTLTVGGINVRNWDRRAHGLVDTTTLLVDSLNVGAATVAMAMGTDEFYARMRAFGMGQATRVDLTGEEAGIMRVPGDSDWSESNLATNSYGQGVTVTPLQMLTAINAIANDGLMMQPRIVYQIIDGDKVIDSQPSALGRVISKQTADIVTEMMVQVVEHEGGVARARVNGYTIAGKTGTAEIPSPTGYETGANSSIVTFVGFLPADDPQISILIKLDRPNEYWGSIVAAPVFRQLAERLVILMGIPNDQTRLLLQAEGGRISSGGR